MKKFFSAILVSAIVATMVVGCGGKTVESRSEKPQTETQVKDEKTEEHTSAETIGSMKYVGLKVYDPVYIALEK